MVTTYIRSKREVSSGTITSRTNVKGTIMSTKMEYAGFWIRFAAFVIDSILMMLLLIPAINVFMGHNVLMTSHMLTLGFWPFLFNYVLPAAVIIVFWIAKSATPGKLVLQLKIVDEKTGLQPSVGQFIGRYIAYYLSTIPFMLGFFWIAIDPKKQGWHDKLAGTVVVRQLPQTTVKFDESPEKKAAG